MTARRGREPYTTRLPAQATDGEIVVAPETRALTGAIRPGPAMTAARVLQLRDVLKAGTNLRLGQ